MRRFGGRVRAHRLTQTDVILMLQLHKEQSFYKSYQTEKSDNLLEALEFIKCAGSSLSRPNKSNSHTWFYINLTLDRDNIHDLYSPDSFTCGVGQHQAGTVSGNDE